MKTWNALSIAVAVGFAGLWTSPLLRAVRLHQIAADYLRDTDSADGAWDVAYSNALIFSYAASLLACFAFAWFVRRPRWALLLPAALLLYAVGDVILLRPERQIVFIPDMYPLRPALISFGGLTIAAATIVFMHLRMKKAAAALKSR